MIKKNNQNQQSGDSSTNIQAQNITINQGLNSEEARNIALDIYRSNFIELSSEAAKIALDQIKSFNDKFITKLHEENSNLIQKFQDPSFQISLLNAQRECVRSNDKNIEDLLVEVLIERAEQDKRGIMQIAFEESINVLPKLTDKQINILTLNFIVNDKYYHISTFDALKSYLSKWIVQFKEEIEFDSPSIRHIEYCGCGTKSNIHHKGLTAQIMNICPGLFSNGFSLEEFHDDFADTDKFNCLIKECERDSKKIQLNAVNSTSLNRIIEESGFEFTKDERIKLYQYLKKNILRRDDLEKILIEIEPDSKFIFASSNSDILNLKLSPVGLAIATANLQKTLGYKIGLPYWVTRA